MKIQALEAQHVEYIPRELAEGILYVSLEFNTASQLCCCGCGTKVVTPLGATEYRLTGSGNAITLFPSIGNWNYPCQSHYWVRGGKVIVAGQMTKAEIALGRKYDDALKDAYFGQPTPWWKQLWDALVSAVKGK